MDDEGATVARRPAEGYGGWWGLVEGDYDRAVIRLATIANNKISHLIFASVELLPPEAPTPPNVERCEPCANSRLMFSRTVLSLADGLFWYGSAWDGVIKVPNRPATVPSQGLGAEPESRRLVLRSDTPFSPSWHGSPRVHRLVPAAEPAPLLADMLAGMESVNRWRRAREWFEAQLHFDVFLADDWFGGVVLVAPNPLLRGHGVRLRPGTSGETLMIAATPRRGVSLSGLEIVVQERRADGFGLRMSAPLDALHSAHVTVPGSFEQVGQQVFCRIRGLLDDDPPAHFFRSVSVQMQSEETVGQRVSHPPPGQDGKPLPPVVTAVRKAKPKSSRSERPIDRVRSLQQRRDAHAGRTLALSTVEAMEDVNVFENDRSAAVRFIQGLVRTARTRIAFVDAYLDVSDFMNFAYAIELEDVSVRGLIDPRPKMLRKAPIHGPPGIATNGDWLQRHLADMRRPDQFFGDVQVRVCRERRFHDRFLVIDDAVWHCGHSFNGVGSGEVSAMSRVARPEALRNLIDEVFNASEAFEDYWARAREPGAADVGEDDEEGGEASDQA